MDKHTQKVLEMRKEIKSLTYENKVLTIGASLIVIAMLIAFFWRW